MSGGRQVALGGKSIGGGQPCYFLAEIAGSFANEAEAARIVDAAVRAGADAVKFQTFDPNTITTRSNCFDMPAVGTRSQYEVFCQEQAPAELQRFVVRYCRGLGVTAFSAPSHVRDLELMLELDMPAWKIGSDLATHIPLLREVARTGKPIFLSTGMCGMEEVERSVAAIREEGNEELLLFHCVSNYPGLAQEQNLRAMAALRERFGVPVGFSDHVPGLNVSLAAVALGADMIERHFWCEGNQAGADRGISSDEAEFRRLTLAAAEIRLALGSGRKEPSASEQRNLSRNRVSIILMQDAPAGAVLTSEMVDIRRPGTGLPPQAWPQVLGRRLAQGLPAETPLTWEHLEP